MEEETEEGGRLVFREEVNTVGVFLAGTGNTGHRCVDLNPAAINVFYKFVFSFKWDMCEWKGSNVRPELPVLDRHNTSKALARRRELTLPPAGCVCVR